MIQERFKNIFVINVAKYKERKEQAKINLKKIGMEEGVDYEFFRATTGRSKFAKLNGIPSDGWNKNAAGLVYTTKRIIEKAKKEGLDSVFIMEDDVDFVNNFNEIYSSHIKKLPDVFDFFHLNATHQRQPTWYNGIIHKLKGARCCQAYAVHNSVYDAYLEFLNKSDMPIDEATLLLHKERDNSYCTVPNIVVHKEGNYSSLRERIVLY